MKVNQLIDKLQKDWKVILICFAVASVTYIFHQTSIIDKRSFVIPVNVVENGDFMVSSNFNTKVTVSIKANSENISSIHASQLFSFINLDSITETGEYELPVQLSLDDELLSYDPLQITIKPETVKVQIDRIGVKYVAVQPVFVGEPAHGYEFKDFSVEPAFVKVTGPSQILKSVDSIITEKVLLQDLKRSAEISVNSDQINKLVTLADKGPYNVKVSIDYIESQMDFLEIPVNIKNLNPEFEIKSTIPSVGITLAGRLLSLENFKNIGNVAAIDFSEIKTPGSYDMQINYTVPGAYELVQTSMETITVIVEKIPEEEPEPAVAEETSEASGEVTE